MLNYVNCLLRIIVGLFIPNKKYSIPKQCWQIFSRFSWEIPQTLLGFIFSIFYSLSGKVLWVHFSNGATIIQCKVNFGGFSLSNYIVGNTKINGNPSQRLFQHEYGHLLQSKVSGIIYLLKYALPSLISSYRHDFYGHCIHPVEQDANIRAKNYWDNYYQHLYIWDNDYNPIYKHIKAASIEWYDFIPVYFPVIHAIKAFKK
jgi:hypothetical protein